MSKISIDLIRSESLTVYPAKKAAEVFFSAALLKFRSPDQAITLSEGYKKAHQFTTLPQHRELFKDFFTQNSSYKPPAWWSFSMSNDVKDNPLYMKEKEQFYQSLSARESMDTAQLMDYIKQTHQK